MLEHLWAILSGAIFVLAVIAGIGPQNLNTLNHAIQKNHAYPVATTCFLADSTLILAGGIGLTLADSHLIILFINLIGILFMTGYLLLKIRGLFQHRSKLTIKGELLTQRQAILRALALTWLNPLVFIDTIVVIGGTATQYIGSRRIDFIVGALLGDLVWLFGLTFVASALAHKLNRTSVWISLDILTIGIMLIILYKTILFVVIK
ncbi:MAG: LysE/ArgO family amino acid transporter [Burkholderiales bacterium]